MLFLADRTEIVAEVVEKASKNKKKSSAGSSLPKPYVYSATTQWTYILVLDLYKLGEFDE